MTVTVERSVEDHDCPAQTVDRRQVGRGGVRQDVRAPTRPPGAARRGGGGRSEDIDRAVRAARHAFESGPWRRMTPSERGRALWKLADLIETHAEEFAAARDARQRQAARRRARRRRPLAVDHFRYYAGWATKIEGETIPVSIPGQHDSSPTRCASRSASSARSSRGTSRC